jgi:hypothetical protein
MYWILIFCYIYLYQQYITNIKDMKVTKQDLAFIIPSLIFVGVIIYTGIQMAMVNPLI